MTIRKPFVATAFVAASLLGGTVHAAADAGAEGAAVGSPGVVSGNTAQVPIQLPIDFCGNTVTIVGLLTPTFSNTCVNS